MLVEVEVAEHHDAGEQQSSGVCLVLPSNVRRSPMHCLHQCQSVGACVDGLSSTLPNDCKTLRTYSVVTTHQDRLCSSYSNAWHGTNPLQQEIKHASCEDADAGT